MDAKLLLGQTKNNFYLFQLEKYKYFVKFDWFMVGEA